MAATYSFTSHTAPVTATVSTLLPSSVEGLSPAQTFCAVSDPRAPAYVFLPTAISADGFPTAMVAVATASGTVT